MTLSSVGSDSHQHHNHELDMLLRDLKDVCRRASKQPVLAAPPATPSAKFVASLEELDRILKELRAHKSRNEDEAITTLDKMFESAEDTVISANTGNDEDELDEAVQELEKLMQSLSELKIRRTTTYMQTNGVDEDDAIRILGSFAGQAEDDCQSTNLYHQLHPSYPKNHLRRR